MESIFLPKVIKLWFLPQNWPNDPNGSIRLIRMQFLESEHIYMKNNLIDTSLLQFLIEDLIFYQKLKFCLKMAKIALMWRVGSVKVLYWNQRPIPPTLSSPLFQKNELRSIISHSKLHCVYGESGQNADFARIKMADGPYISAQLHCARGIRTAHSCFLSILSLWNFYKAALNLVKGRGGVRTPKTLPSVRFWTGSYNVFLS